MRYRLTELAYRTAERGLFILLVLAALLPLLLVGEGPMRAPTPKQLDVAYAMLDVG